MNPYLEQILGQGPAAEAEAQCVEAFVKQASAEGIDISKLPDEKVEQLYEQVFKPKYAEALSRQNSADGLIEKAAAEGASDEVLEKLALAKLTGEAMAEGYVERMAKFAQEAEMAEAAAPAAPPPEVPPEGGGEAEGGGEEAAKAIVEEAVDEAVEEVAQQAEAAGVEASPEELAQAAAPMIEQKVEEKTSALVAYADELDKQASMEAKEAAGKIRAALSAIGGAARKAGGAIGSAAKKPWLNLPAAAAAGAGAGALAHKALAGKKKKAADLVAEMLATRAAEQEKAAALEKDAAGKIRAALGAIRGAAGKAGGAIAAAAKKPYVNLPAAAAAGVGAGALAHKMMAGKKKKASDLVMEALMAQAEQGK